jgi:hypothetical protein
MKRVLITVALVLLTASALPAFEVVGTIRKVDVEGGVLFIYTAGEDRSVRLDRNVAVQGMDGRPLEGGLKARELASGADATVEIDFRAEGLFVTTIRLGKAPAPEPKASIGLKPLSEMTAGDKYKGEDGGLYGGGRNQPPEAHLKIARAETAKIAPRDADGLPAKDGAIGLISISMSNATQEFSLFKQLADQDPGKSPYVTIVDCAQGGQAMAQWANPEAAAWKEADRRLESARVSRNQVQVVWMKLANVLPTGDLAQHGRKLQEDTVAVLQNAKIRFPNLRIAYLGSRIYGGWTTVPLNPEPYAYEGAFAVRWLILDQVNGHARLNADPAKGSVRTPVLLWGPYLWADGTTPRKSDGLIYEAKDVEIDGTHVTESGRRKVAGMLLRFFQTDPLASTWYLRKSSASASR